MARLRVPEFGRALEDEVATSQSEGNREQESLKVIAKSAGAWWFNADEFQAKSVSKVNQDALSATGEL